MCDCCGGVRAVTPAKVYNRPGLPAIAYRAGTHGQFVTSMLARLSSTKYPKLGDLTTRESDDPAVAMLDGWAVIADVLTFYSERIANEGYLPTATEKESLAWLGELVGHRPRPALGADGFLAYTLNGEKATIPAGSQAKSVPAQGEQPQTFETVADLYAEQEWNQLEVRKTLPSALNSTNVSELKQLELDGLVGTLKQGDRMVFAFGANVTPVAKTVHGVQQDPERMRTTVSFSTPDPAAEFETTLDALIEALPDPRWELRTELGGQVNGTIDSIAGLTPAYGPSWVHSVLTDALDRLRAAIAVAEARGICEVVDRVDELEIVIGKAETAKQAAAVAGRLSESGSALLAQSKRLHGGLGNAVAVEGAGTSNGGGGCVKRSQALLGLTRMLPALTKAPSRPPARARYLVSDVQGLFADESDVHGQLLMAAQPRLADTLYTAWRNADLSAPLPLARLEGMRTKAHVFGATTQLQAGQTEQNAGWPGELIPSIVVHLTAELRYEAGRPQQVSLTYQPPETEPAATRLDLTDAPGARTAALSGKSGRPGSMGYRVARDRDGEWQEIRLTGDLPARTIRVARRETATYVTVRDRGRTASLALTGQGSTSTPMGGDSITVTVDEGEDADTVTVALEVTPRHVLPLDAVYSDIVAGTYVVVERASIGTIVTKVVRVDEVTKRRGNTTATVTQLTLADPWLFDADGFSNQDYAKLLAAIRETTVFANGEALKLVADPDPDPVSGKEIELAKVYGGMRPGRWLIVAGERGDVPDTTGVPAAELVMLAELRQILDPDQPGEPVRTRLVLANALSYAYRRDTVRIYGNVAEVSQGETRKEPLGSGDATQAGQAFELSQAPLTYLPAVNAFGAQAELTTRVNGVRWHETESLVFHGGTDRVYTLGLGATPEPPPAPQITAVFPPEAAAVPPPEPHTKLTFGDGVHGSRLPTGVENVTGDYRVGAGRSGNVAAGSITQLTTRPSGVSEVTNPIATGGGTDADGPDDTRVVMPLRMLALDRLVSVRDYEDFARARAGIGKASARKLYDGRRHSVHVTIAAADDVYVDESSALVTTLEQALSELGDIALPLHVAIRERVLLVISAGVKVLPDYSWDLVEPNVRAAVADTFGFDRRRLGQPAYLSEAVAAMQHVEGVDYVDVDVFAGIPGQAGPEELATIVETLEGAAPCVPARLASFEERVEKVRSDSLSEFAGRFGLTVQQLLALNPSLADIEINWGERLVVWRGIHPAQLAVFDPSIPETLVLRRIV